MKKHTKWFMASTVLIILFISIYAIVVVYVTTKKECSETIQNAIWIAFSTLPVAVIYCFRKYLRTKNPEIYKQYYNHM